MAKILSVDDSRTIRQLVQAILEKEGHEVVTAVDGIDALQIAREQKFDLVLTDINMPNMNGISFVSKLRLIDGYATVPVVMLTTESSDFKKNKARSMGATGWLQKPFTPERLVNAVNRLVG
jgi:two-component system chemotaxis response regulator CheY